MIKKQKPYKRLKEKVKTAKKRKISSTRWLQRQLNDPYVKQSKAEGRRSRAAYKLIQINEKFDLLRPNQVVLDLGAAPGGWTQVVLERAVYTQKVVAVDISDMMPISGVEILQLDMNGSGVIPKILLALGGKADVVLSDMSPPTTGHKHTDHYRTMGLCQIAFDVANAVLDEGGTLVVKVFQGGTENILLEQLKKSFSSVKHVKPPASRKESRETYLVALGFRI